MKKIIAVLTLVASMFSVQAFATGEENVTQKAISAFTKEFPGATYAKWEPVKGYDLYSVRFYYENQGYLAYIDLAGEIVGSARLVTPNNLPFKVSQVIKQNYSDAQILKIEELTMENGLSYIFTMEHKGQRVVLRVYSDGNFQKLPKEKKNKKGF